ncbi:MAG: urease subunit beta [Alistipes sp.]|nr:urease subunit beta [Alistipes sp.]
MKTDNKAVAAKTQPQSKSLYPNKPGFKPQTKTVVGGVVLKSDPIDYNVGRRTVKVTVRNTGDRPIQVGSHFHFFEVNRYLEFDREAAFGCHLNIPSTTAIRFEPGDQKDVELVTYSGKRRIMGFNGLVMGYTGDEDAPAYYPARIRAMHRMAEAGFKSAQLSSAKPAAPAAASSKRSDNVKK